MTATHSVTYVTTIADRDAMNAYFASLGWGAQNLMVQLSASGQLPTTHYAAHTYHNMDVVATLQAAKASTDSELDALNGLFIYAVESNSPKFNEAVSSAEIIAAFGTTLQMCNANVDP